jgi:hypothetical protein
MSAHFSENRFDINIIKIFTENIHSKSPCYDFELEALYNELIYAKQYDAKWFTNNCLELN